MMHILAYLNPVNTKSHYLAVHMRTCWPSKYAKGKRNLGNADHAWTV